MDKRLFACVPVLLAILLLLMNSKEQRFVNYTPHAWDSGYFKTLGERILSRMEESNLHCASAAEANSNYRHITFQDRDGQVSHFMNVARIKESGSTLKQMEFATYCPMLDRPQEIKSLPVGNDKLKYYPYQSIPRHMSVEIEHKLANGSVVTEEFKGVIAFCLQKYLALFDTGVHCSKQEL